MHTFGKLRIWKFYFVKFELTCKNFTNLIAYLIFGVATHGDFIFSWLEIIKLLQKLFCRLIRIIRIMLELHVY